MSSTINHLFDLPEQICYVQCGFCTTILLVSVPCSSLSRVVTVRCGHCTSLLSVSMIKASFVPLHVLASLHHDHDEYKGDGESGGQKDEKATWNSDSTHDQVLAALGDTNLNLRNRDNRLVARRSPVGTCVWRRAR
ncbi:hypothetical protein LWI29_012546 [Acer saccharum]|uniref:YABBY N-terminal domain-containing protein n=1 Tax=Acer saccharum TaxID=4024 RepID=A0AA39RHW6_ACESA|nr:hypothetical protein LWI29_012546 [Acer saccharum]